MGDVTVMRNMKREDQMLALQRMLATNHRRAKLAQDQCAAILHEINRLKRMDAEDAGHVMVKLER